MKIRCTTCRKFFQPHPDLADTRCEDCSIKDQTHQVIARLATKAGEASLQKAKDLAVVEAGFLLRRLRDLGWTVAVHNDYRLGGKAMTFWLMTKGELAFKGEGETDLEALQQIWARVQEL